MTHNNKDLKDIIEFIIFQFSKLNINFNDYFEQDDDAYYTKIIYTCFKSLNNGYTSFQINLTINEFGKIEVLLIRHNEDNFILEFEANYRDISFYNIIKDFINNYLTNK